jgi:hypothetical protein
VIASHYPRQATLSRPRDENPATVTPLAATLMDLPASVANKRLTAELNPLAATLTKTRGCCFPRALRTARSGGPAVLRLFGSLTFQPFNFSTISQPVFSTAYALFQVTYPVTPVFATLTKTAGCIPKIPILEHTHRMCLDVQTFRHVDVPTIGTMSGLASHAGCALLLRTP